MKHQHISPEILDELLKGCDRPGDLLGERGLMRDPKKALMERMLGAIDRLTGQRARANTQSF